MKEIYENLAEDFHKVENTMSCQHQDNENWVHSDVT